MKTLTLFCRSRWFAAVVTGLGVMWAMSASLGWGVGAAIGGGITVTMLSTRREN
ncbi:hypothetical protein [Actomonas aquatica]|uniref:Uncharacterized protein n=1 Tax=Actomonas aquatica TaxID=2866162 RepID=A0ABZ1CEE1_9BACT|nr:hypothetical protein [Opitutus sp. WL0086]WRQ90057.1 hypothetical protein K1X11_011615 [Opitutus sp. WL0086]